MSAPEPCPWEIGPPRPAAGFPWTTHRTLWDVAHGHTPDISSVPTRGSLIADCEAALDRLHPRARRIPTRLLPPNPPTRK